MSLLDTWIQMNDIRNDPLIPTNSLVQVRTLLLKLMKQVLNQSLNALKSTSPFAKWVRMLRPGDTVISFNWDVAIEQCDQEFDKQPLLLRYLPSGPHNALTILKPHGSVNWYEMPSEGYESVDGAHPFRKDWRRCAYADCKETLKFPSKFYGRRRYSGQKLQMNHSALSRSSGTISSSKRTDNILMGRERRVRYAENRAGCCSSYSGREVRPHPRLRPSPLAGRT